MVTTGCLNCNYCGKMVSRGNLCAHHYKRSDVPQTNLLNLYAQLVLRQCVPHKHMLPPVTVESKQKLVSGHCTFPVMLRFVTRFPLDDSSVLGAGMQVFKNLIFLIKNTAGGQALSLIQEDSLFGFPPVLLLITSLTLKVSSFSFPSQFSSFNSTLRIIGYLSAVFFL